jgi:hypothetical protein
MDCKLSQQAMWLVQDRVPQVLQEPPGLAPLELQALLAQQVPQVLLDRQAPQAQQDQLLQSMMF